jgi:glycosyltransferase involved in cell wall biosynthesis
MTRLLSVATAAVHPEQLSDTAHLRFPRVDYIELQRLLDAETLDYSAYSRHYAGRFLRRLETQLRSDVYLATLSWWKSLNHPLVFAWSERAGIPLAGYKRLTRSKGRFVSMFQCWSARQELVITTFGLFNSMDAIIVHCKSMRDNLIQLGAPRERIRLVHYSIDQNFFAPRPGLEPRKNVIMSIGEPRSRDYASLFEAVKGLSLTLEVAGFGHWYAREKNSSMGVAIPENVTMLNHLPQSNLRDQYASSQFVVIPVYDLVYSAGATASMEAGSMGRAVIAFHSRGISDYIIDRETGILVEPGNIQAMREAIQYLMANPKEAKRLGENARQRILEELNLETYVKKIAEVLTQNIPKARPEPVEGLS